jgi:hypothetical protein
VDNVGQSSTHFNNRIVTLSATCSTCTFQVASPAVSRCMHCNEDIPIEDVAIHWCINRAQSSAASGRRAGVPFPVVRSSCDLQKLESCVGDRTSGFQQYAVRENAHRETIPTDGNESLAQGIRGTRKLDDDADPWSALARDQLLVLDGTGPTICDCKHGVLCETGNTCSSSAPSKRISGTPPIVSEDASDPWSALLRDQQLVSIDASSEDHDMTPVQVTPPPTQSRRLSTPGGSAGTKTRSSVHVRARTDSVDDALFYCDVGSSPYP